VVAPASGAATATAPAITDSNYMPEIEGRPIRLSLVNGDGISATPIGNVATNEFGMATMTFTLRLTLD